MPTPVIIGDLRPAFIGQTTVLDMGAAGGPNIQLPPFKWTDGKVYVAYTNVDSHFNQFCAVGVSPDGVVPFASLDSANNPLTQFNMAPSVILDAANSRILFLGSSNNASVDSVALAVFAFDLVTKKWVTPLATAGPLCFTSGSNMSATLNPYNNTFICCISQLSSTRYLVVFYQAGSLTPTVGCTNLMGVIISGGVWGTPFLIVAGTGSVSFPQMQPVFAGLGLAAPGVAVALYAKCTETSFVAGTNPVFGNRLDVSGSGSVIGEFGPFFTDVEAAGPTIACMGRGVYNSATDTLRFGFLYPFNFFASSSPSPALTKAANVLTIAAASTAPVASFDPVGSPSFSGEWSSPDFFTSLDGSTFYFAVVQVTASGGPCNMGVETIQLFQRPASGPPGTWSGPTAFYDASVNPAAFVSSACPASPSPPAELSSLAFAFFADGTLATTVGFLGDTCGVIFYLQIPGSRPPTLTLTFKGLKVYP